MLFWVDGFPAIRYRTGAALGFTYWVDGFPAGDVTQAVVDGGTMSVAMNVYIPLFNATIDPLIVPVKMTQMGRQVTTEEAAPGIRITQLGRNVMTEEGAPGVRMTQMGRQVLYRFTCGGDTPGPTGCPESLVPLPASGSGCSDDVPVTPDVNPE